MKKSIVLTTLAATIALFFCGCADNTPEKSLSRAREAAVSGNWQEAYSLAEKLEEIYPQNIRVLLMLAVSADKCGKTDRAIDAARRAVLLDDKSFAAQYTLGKIYSNIPERRNEALQILAKAYSLKNDDPAALILMCNTAKISGNRNYENYLKVLEKTDPAQRPGVRNNLGVAAAKRGDLKQAQSDFAVATSAGEPVALLNTARFFDYYSRNPKFAVSFYRQFLRAAADKNEFAGDRAEVERRIRQLQTKR